MNWKRASIFLVICGLLAGCYLPAPDNSAPTLAPITRRTGVVTVIPARQTALPNAPISTAVALETSLPPGPATLGPQPEPTLTEPPVDAVFTPFAAASGVDALKLRTGPGYLFPAAILIAKGESLTVLGRSHGDEWVYVKAKSGLQGWVFAQLVQPERDLRSAPEVEPGDVYIVHGRVVDQAGTPVNGIQFALVQGSGEAAPRTDAITDAHGDFYAFFPKTSSGEWSVSYTAVACTSRVMDKNCSCQAGSCGTAHPASIQIQLPQEQILQFTWE